MRGNAWLIETSKFAERRLLNAWKCAELRLPIAWKCAEMRPANAWKCAEPRLAWECESRGCLRTAARVRGTRVGSAREVRLKCGSSEWNRGSTHWWVPYLYGTGTLRVNTWLQWIGQGQLQDETTIIWVVGFGASCIGDFTVIYWIHSNHYNGTTMALWQQRKFDCFFNN